MYAQPPRKLEPVQPFFSTSEVTTQRQLSNSESAPAKQMLPQSPVEFKQQGVSIVRPQPESPAGAVRQQSILKNEVAQNSRTLAGTTAQVEIPDGASMAVQTAVLDHGGAKQKCSNVDRPPIRPKSPPIDENNYLERLGLFNNDLWPNLAPFNCPKCGTAVDGFQGVIIKNCLIHKFCR